MTAKIKTSEVRIIGGSWRGRKIVFPAIDGLRPSPNRVRETLFNWLRTKVINARCLDAFAGSGVLGFEALSRGASSVTMVDCSNTAVKFLHQNKKTLFAQNCHIYKASFPSSFILTDSPFDLVFLDPPFYQGCIAKSCEWLIRSGCLAVHAYVYIEAEKQLTNLGLTPPWKCIKSGRAGEVAYYLFSS